jgi:hypothetical protein
MDGVLGEIEKIEHSANCSNQHVRYGTRLVHNWDVQNEREDKLADLAMLLPSYTREGADSLEK